jgi:hypothetical protein
VKNATTVDSSSDDRGRVSEEIATRLRAKGVRLSGRESSEQLSDLLEAVERFEAAVEQHGGDLMVDEPIRGNPPIAPDRAAFVLPARRGDESVTEYLARIDEAVEALRRTRRNP